MTICGFLKRLASAQTGGSFGKASQLKMTLELRPYGNTGEQVTAIGFGAASLAKYSVADGEATVRRALELGINYFDTSPIYGRGASQVILGAALQGRTEPYMVATKLGYLTNPQDFRSKDALRTQLWESLRSLRRTNVDVLQVHMSEWSCWWEDDAPDAQLFNTNESYDFANAPVMQVLRDARDQGLCRFIGITGDEADQVAHVLRHVDVDACLIAYHSNLLFRRSLQEAIPLAREKGAAFVSAGVLHPGFPGFGKADWLDTPPAWVTPEVRGRLEKLYDLQRDSGLSMVALVVRYPLANRDITILLLGVGKVAELEDSVEAALAGPLPADLRAAIDELGFS